MPMGRRRKLKPKEVFGCLVLLLLLGLLSALIDAFKKMPPQGWAGITILIGGAVVANYLHRGWKRHRALDGERAIKISDVDNMEGVRFEQYIGHLLQYRGFSVAVTKASGDLGADIVARKGWSKYAIQVKRHDGHVSRRAVSDAVAAMTHYKCNCAMVITNSYFSTGAKKLPESTNCVLVDRNTLARRISDFERG